MGRMFENSVHVKKCLVDVACRDSTPSCPIAGRLVETASHIICASDAMGSEDGILEKSLRVLLRRYSFNGKSNT